MRQVKGQGGQGVANLKNTLISTWNKPRCYATVPTATTLDQLPVSAYTCNGWYDNYMIISNCSKGIVRARHWVMYYALN